jgi:hypothetical protein
MPELPPVTTTHSSPKSNWTEPMVAGGDDAD